MAAEAGRFDVVVLGGGPAGAATALALRQDPALRVAVVEKSGYGGLRVGESVPPVVEEALRALGAGWVLATGGHLPSAGTGSAWGGGELGFHDFLLHPAGRGWHLDRAAFDEHLARHAEDRGAELLLGWRVGREDEPRSGRRRLTLVREDGGRVTSRQVDASVVVDAEGRRSAFAVRRGARRVTVDRLVAVAARFSGVAAGEDGRAWIEAAEDGWWYAAPVPRGEAVAMWMSDSDLVRGQGLHRSGPWEERLGGTRHVRRIVTGAGRLTSFRIHAAASQCLDRVAGRDWLAVGDAACALDPLSSAGIVKALRSAVEAAAAIRGHLAGDGGAFAGYDERVRRRFAAYLLERREMYRREVRWPLSAFWRRRQGRRAGPA